MNRKNLKKCYSASVVNSFCYFDIYLSEYLSVLSSNHTSQKNVLHKHIEDTIRRTVAFILCETREKIIFCKEVLIYSSQHMWE